MAAHGGYTLDIVIVFSILFWVSEVIVLSIVLAPVSRFVRYGWQIRKQEFTNRLRGKPIGAYLERFWNSTISAKKYEALAEDAKFSGVYDLISGRTLYLTPLFLLLGTLIIFGGIAIMTGLRAGYEMYIQQYQQYKTVEVGIFTQDIVHLPLSAIDRAFFPFPSIAFSFATLASVAGAYLYTVQVVIRGYKSRTLLSSDLLWGGVSSGDRHSAGDVGRRIDRARFGAAHRFRPWRVPDQ